MAQEVLNFFDIHAILKASGSESMAEKVRGNIEVDTAVDPRVAIDLALLLAFLITLFFRAVFRDIRFFYYSSRLDHFPEPAK